MSFVKYINGLFVIIVFNLCLLFIQNLKSNDLDGVYRQYYRSDNTVYGNTINIKDNTLNLVTIKGEEMYAYIDKREKKIENSKLYLRYSYSSVGLLIVGDVEYVKKGSRLYFECDRN